MNKKTFHRSHNFFSLQTSLRVSETKEIFLFLKVKSNIRSIYLNTCFDHRSFCAAVDFLFLNYLSEFMSFIALSFTARLCLDFGVC